MVFLCSCGGLIWENRVHICGTSKCSCEGIKFDGRVHFCGYKPDYSKPPTEYERWRGLRSSDEWMGSPNWGKRCPSLFNTKNQETGILNSASSMEEIRNIQQTGSFQSYCNSFDSLLTKVLLSEDYATSLFMRGLKPRIGFWVKLFEPKSLEEAYERAKKQDYLWGEVPSANSECNEIDIQTIDESKNEVEIQDSIDQDSCDNEDLEKNEHEMGSLNQVLSIQAPIDSDGSNENKKDDKNFQDHVALSYVTFENNQHEGSTLDQDTSVKTDMCDQEIREKTTSLLLLYVTVMFKEGIKLRSKLVCGRVSASNRLDHQVNFVLLDKNRVWEVGLIVVAEYNEKVTKTMEFILDDNDMKHRYGNLSFMIWMQQNLVFQSDLYDIWMVPWLDVITNGILRVDISTFNEMVWLSWSNLKIMMLLVALYVADVGRRECWVK